MTEEQKNEKLANLLSELIGSIEDNLKDGDYRYNQIIVYTFASVCMASVLQHQGIFKFIRAIIGAINLRLRFPNIIEVDKK